MNSKHVLGIVGLLVALMIGLEGTGEISRASPLSESNHPSASYGMVHPAAEQTTLSRVPAMCRDDPPVLVGGMLEWALESGVKNSRLYWAHRRAREQGYWTYYACRGY